MKIIQSDLIPAPGGHYSPAIVSGGLLYVSGQLPISPGGVHHEKEDFEAQFAVVFSNIETILRAAGSDKNKIVKLTAYIADIELWPVFNRLYAGFMGDHRPVRTVVPVPGLHYGYKIEVDLIAEL